VAPRLGDAVKESFAHRSRSELSILDRRARRVSSPGFKLALQNKAFLHLLAGDRIADSIAGTWRFNSPQPRECAHLRNRFSRRIRRVARQSR